MPTVEDVTPGEIVRTLRGLQEEIRALRGEHVRRDLYAAERAAQAAEIARIDERCRADLARLEREVATREQERVTMRRGVTLAVLAAGLALLGQIVAVLVG
jgi:serine phosphatase RsbU (regulator of sigma subunit)